jgi:hypothetical protein
MSVRIKEQNLTVRVGVFHTIGGHISGPWSLFRVAGGLEILDFLVNGE